MKQWLAGLEPRGRKLVLALAGMMVIAAGYYFLIQPLAQRFEMAEKGVKRETQLLSWVQENAAKIVILRGANGVKPAARNRSVSQIINTSAARYKLTVNRIQPKNNKLQVMVDHVQFSVMLQWLQTLQLQHGLTVDVADFRRENESGFVKVRLLVSQ
ncbi:MAG: type II secretion system protein M [Psychrobium sp.]|nr:type II secretion system protein M [Psychrobium sp.]